MYEWAPAVLQAAQSPPVFNAYPNLPSPQVPASCKRQSCAGPVCHQAGAGDFQEFAHYRREAIYGRCWTLQLLLPTKHTQVRPVVWLIAKECSTICKALKPTCPCMTEIQSVAGCIARSAAVAGRAATAPAASCPVQLSADLGPTSATAAAAQCRACGVCTEPPANPATAAECRALELSPELALDPAAAVRRRRSTQRSRSPRRTASAAAAVSAIWSGALRVHAGHAGPHAAAARSGPARRMAGGGHSCGAAPGPATELHAAGSPGG